MASSPAVTVKKMKQYIGDPRLRQAHKMMRVVSGVSRFSILMLLSRFGGEINVTDLAEALGTSCSLVSHELHLLRNAGLVTRTWKGREAFYKGSAKLKGMLPRF